MLIPNEENDKKIMLKINTDTLLKLFKFYEKPYWKK